MKIDATTPIWVVTDPSPHSTLPDICFETNLSGLALQARGGLDLGAATIYTTQEEAHDDATNRLLVYRIFRGDVR